MDKKSHILTKLGTRKIQRGSSGYILNVPRVAIDSLEWQAHDDVYMTIVDNEYIVIKKVTK